MKASSIIVPVADIATALTFYCDVMGFKAKFRDGDRYCAIDLGGFTLALVAGEEKIVDEAALTVKVEDITAGLAQLTAHGAQVVRPAEQGPHEARAVLRAPGGPLIVLSAPNRPVAK